MTYKRVIVVAGWVVSAGLAVAAQERTQVFFEEAVQLPPQGAIDVIALDPVDMGQPVVDAPYSADAVTEVTQVLADGNRIEQRTAASIARDGDGRTRREQQGIALGRFVAQSTQPMVTITDPKSGVHLTLNYDQKVAYRMKPGRMRMLSDAAQRTGGSIAYGAVGTMSTRQAGAPMPPPPGFDAGRRVEMAAPADTFEVIAPPPPFVSVAAAPWEGAVKSETLEPKQIEGVRAEGTRTTITIAAGAMGNALPIEIVSERWFSPELKVVLLTRRFDPRFGETVYRLTNIVRSEPAPELFKVPADFRIDDGRP